MLQLHIVKQRTRRQVELAEHMLPGSYTEQGLRYCAPFCITTMREAGRQHTCVQALGDGIRPHSGDVVTDVRFDDQNAVDSSMAAHFPCGVDVSPNLGSP